MRYWRVSPRFWSDEKVLRWSDDTRLLALYLLTNPHRTTVAGLYRLPTPYMLADLGWPRERLEQAFRQLQEDGFAEYDAASGVVLVVHALRYQRPENSNALTHEVEALADLPATPLLARLVGLAEEACEPLAQRLGERLGQRLGEYTTTTTSTAPPLGEPFPKPLPERLGERLETAAEAALSPGDPGDAQVVLLGDEDPSPEGGGTKARGKKKAALPITPARVVEIWNEIAPPLPAAMKLSDGRRRKLVARITAEPGRDEAWWRAYFGRVLDSPFLRGENDSGWKADLDWVIASEDRVTRILEGRYDRRTPPKPKRPQLPEW